MPVTPVQMRPAIPATAALELLRTLEGVGENCARSAPRRQLHEFLATQSLPPHLVRLSVAQFAPLFRECTLALEAQACRLDGRPTHPVDYMRMWCHCIITCARLHEVMERSCEFFGLLSALPGTSTFAVTVTSGSAIFHMQTRRRHRGASGALTDLIGLGAQARLFSWLIGEELPIEEAHLSYPEGVRSVVPGSLATYPLRFGEDCNRLRFDASYLSRPVVRSPQDLEAYLKLYPWDFSLAEQPPVLMSDSVVSVFRNAMMRRTGVPNLQQLALMFGCSSTTLRRRLSTEDTSVQILKETCRRALAQELLLRSTLSCEAIAARLDYSDAGTFTRAFRDWLGMTPAAFRRQAAETQRLAAS